MLLSNLLIPSHSTSSLIFKQKIKHLWKKRSLHQQSLLLSDSDIIGDDEIDRKKFKKKQNTFHFTQYSFYCNIL